MSFFDQLLKRRSHYRLVFNSDSGKKVLSDLTRFAKYGDSPAVVSTVRQQIDVHATFIRIGRQEMLQRIATHLHLDDAQLLKLKQQTEED